MDCHKTPLPDAQVSSRNDLLFQQALLHIMGRELGMEDHATEHPPSTIIRHVNFLASTVYQLAQRWRRDGNHLEREALCQTVHVFIQFPLEKLQVLAECRPAMIKWKAWSDTQGFDVQLCVVLQWLYLVACEIEGTGTRRGCSSTGYHSLEFKEMNWYGKFWRYAEVKEYMIAALPTTSILSFSLRDAFEKRISRACEQKRRKLPSRSITLTIDLLGSVVIVSRCLTGNSLEEMERVLECYRVDTDECIVQPPAYEELETDLGSQGGYWNQIAKFLFS